MWTKANGVDDIMAQTVPDIEVDLHKERGNGNYTTNRF